MKAKKGNPFEYNVAYSLIQAGLDVRRIDDNTAGVDLVADDQDKDMHYYIECKHHKGFSWNELIKIFEKTKKIAQPKRYTPLVVFRSNRQPVLVMYEMPYFNDMVIMTFEGYWATPFIKRPKGYKIWDTPT